MKTGKRLYDMGGDVIADYFPSNMAENTMWPGRKNKASKKANRYNKRNICRQGMKCYNPNR